MKAEREESPAGSSPSPRIVELVGPPGSGKSLAVHLLGEVLRSRRYEVLTHSDVRGRCLDRTLAGRLSSALAPRPLRRIARALAYRLAYAVEVMRFMGGRPRLASRVLRGQVVRRVPLRERALALGAFCDAIVWWGLCGRRAAPGEILLLDEGFLQRAVNLFASRTERPDARKIRRYVALAPRARLAVYLRSPEGLCVERVRLRGILPDRLAGDAGAGLLRFVAHAREAVEIAAGAARLAGHQVIEVENTGDRLALGESLSRATSLSLPGPEAEHGAEPLGRSAPPEGARREGRG